MTGAPLTDGLASLFQSDERLTTAACWRVKFDRYSFQPCVVVPFDTALNEVEALARRALLEELGRHESADNQEVYAQYVATCRLEVVERLVDAQLHARLG